MKSSSRRAHVETMLSVVLKFRMSEGSDECISHVTVDVLVHDALASSAMIRPCRNIQLLSGSREAAPCIARYLATRSSPFLGPSFSLSLSLSFSLFIPLSRRMGYSSDMHRVKYVALDTRARFQ
jgi:hypothetical protein